MSKARESARPPELAVGWGGGSPTAARRARVTSQDELERRVVEAAKSGVALLVRGYGRSYGDAAQCAGGLLIDGTGLDRLVELDVEAGRARVEAGCSLSALLRAIVPRGFFLPVSPGTATVSVGGAIAADVHGKNHHRAGSFASFVERLSLVTPEGRRELGPDRDPELFWATVGGMGLTGAIAEATIRLFPIETPAMVVDTERGGDLDEVMEKLAEADRVHRYTVAWIDGMARGGRLGRGVVTGADHAGAEQLAAGAGRKARDGRFLADDGSRALSVPLKPPGNLVLAPVVRAFNELYFARAPRCRTGQLQSIPAVFHPLDALEGWNRLYGRRGFTQYQFAVPFGAEPLIGRALSELQANGLAPTLCVLKRFGEADPAPLSFPLPGWTLAVDLALGGRDLALTLDHLDELVASAGGRVYLAKDGRLRPDALAAMYPRLGQWLETRERLDPGGVFVSDLWRRLAPAGGRGE